MSSLEELDPPSSRHIPVTEIHALNSAYGGKRCILTQSGAGVDWAHIIPHDTTRRISNAKLLNLVSPEFNAVHRENLLPLNKVDHINFDTLTWTIYPTLQTLLRLIAHEESQLHHRHLTIESHMPDPGRPAYDAFYGKLESPLPYEVHFGAEFINDGVTRYQDRQTYWLRGDDRNVDPFPTLQLICNVNVVVLMRTSALTRPMLTSASDVFLLGAYLITLWDANPRQIARHFQRRPVSLPPLPSTDPVPNPSITNLTSHAHSTVPPPGLSNTLPQTSMQLEPKDRITHTLSMTLGKLRNDTTSFHNSHPVMSGIPTPPQSPSRGTTRYISPEVRHLVAMRWYRIVYPVLLGEEIIAPPYVPGKSKGLTANEAARLCGVKLARASTTDPWQDTACTLNAEECSAPKKLGKEKLEMVEAWTVSVRQTLWSDPNI